MTTALQPKIICVECGKRIDLNNQLTVERLSLLLAKRPRYALHMRCRRGWDRPIGRKEPHRGLDTIDGSPDAY